jgi:hypothetical protein
MNALQGLLVWFVLVGSGGILMALSKVIRVRLPSWLRIVHGLAGLVGLVALFMVNYHAASTPIVAWLAWGLLTGGLLGGLVLFGILYRGKAPAWAILVHGSAGIAGMALLYAASTS